MCYFPRMATPAVLCTSCGKQISGSEILYTADARVVCQACSDKVSLKGDESRAAGNIQKAAWATLALGLVCWIFDPFFACDIVGILSAIYAMSSMRPSNAQFTRYLTPGGRTQVWVCSIIGMVLLGIHVLIVLLVVAAVTTSGSRF